MQKLKKRVKRKGTIVIDELKDRFIPRNIHLRPKGYFQTIEDYLARSQDKGVFHEAHPEQKVKMIISESMWNDASGYCKPEKFILAPRKGVLDIPNGRVYTNRLNTIAVISGDQKVIGEVSLEFVKKSLPASENKALQFKNFPEIRHVKGNLFHTLGGGGTYINYAHWLVDSLCRIDFLHQTGLFKEVNWFYVPTIKYDYQLDSLKALGITEDKIISSADYPHVQADRVLAPSFARGDDSYIFPWMIEFFREHMMPSAPTYHGPKRIYIRRKDSSVRNVTNEDNVELCLREYGIEAVTLSDLSFLEKVALFANAEVIVSPTGAGLTNLMFCPPTTKLIHIFGSSYVDFILYYDIASRLGLDYQHLIFDNGKKVKNAVEGQHTDITIDIDRLLITLEKMGIGNA